MKTSSKMMSSSLAQISCNAAFREGREGRGGWGKARWCVIKGKYERKVWEDVQSRKEREEGNENGTYGRKAWEEKRQRMVESSM